MNCPYCGRKTHVYSMRSDVKPANNRIAPFTVRRYRRCPKGHKFRSIEEVNWESTMAPVVGSIEKSA